MNVSLDFGPLLTRMTAWNAKSAGIYALDVLVPLLFGEEWQKTQAKIAAFKVF